jgi:hypothetical protein
MVQANVDRIIDFLKTKRTASVAELSKVLNIPKENVQKSLEYLEEDGVLKIDFKFTTPYVTFLKEPNSQGIVPAMKLEEPKDRVKITPAPPIPPKPEHTFFLNESQNESKLNEQKPIPPMPPTVLSTGTGVSSSATFMQMPPETAEEEKKSIPDVNPFDVKPEFDLSTPMPETENSKPILKPVLGYNAEYSEQKEVNFPEYVTSDLEKLDFMIDEANKKITSYQYKDLNMTYRNIYSIFKDAELTPNERYLIGSKVNELFQRIKRVYLLEKTV